MKTSILALLFALLSPVLFARQQAPTLSEQAEISLITCAPGDEALYAAFGHSAVRVHDPVSRIDIAYNYGIFDFEQENFYFNFARGYLLYKLGAWPYKGFVGVYKKYDRTIEEQVLNLSQEQKQKVYAFLYNNALPANQNYLYDYFDNNCATKIRDAMQEALGGDLMFQEGYVEEPRSFRALINAYSEEEQPWGNFGINFGLGSPIDEVATPYEHQFLPDYLRDAFAKAKIGKDGEPQAFVKEYRVVYKGENSPALHPSLFTPDLVFWIAFIFLTILSVWVWMSGRQGRGIDLLVFGLTGLAGLVLFLLATATDHEDTAYNYNMIWAFPLHIFALAFILRKKIPSWMRFYAMITGGLLILLVINWYWLPQDIPNAVIPLILLLLLRLFLVWKRAQERHMKFTG